MAKFLFGKTVTFAADNYGQGNVFVQLSMPMAYSLMDLIQIVKLYTDYDDTYDWTFSNPRDASKTVSLKKHGAGLDDIRFDEFKNISPTILCEYGRLKISIGGRGSLKYRKVFPQIYQAVGQFPTLKEIKKKKTPPHLGETVRAETIAAFGDKLKDTFKRKYQISDEIIEGFFGEENALIRLE